MTDLRSLALPAGAAVLGVHGVLRAVERGPARVRRALGRTNFAGDPVTLAQGPAWVGGVALGALLAADPVAAATVAVPGAVGLVDDLVGDRSTKGIRGHLGALRRGRVTSGAVKVAVLGTTALVVAVLENDRDASLSSRLPALVVDAGVVAGTANLLNLFDLRPGRALKVATLIGAPLLVAAPGRARPALVAGLAATAAALPGDLAGRSMLGDCGANAAGALVGQGLVRSLPLAGRTGVLAAVTALTLASERVSFSRVIDRTPALRALDVWGRPTPVPVSPVTP